MENIEPQLVRFPLWIFILGIVDVARSYFCIIYACTRASYLHK